MHHGHSEHEANGQLAARATAGSLPAGPAAAAHQDPTPHSVQPPQVGSQAVHPVPEISRASSSSVPFQQAASPYINNNVLKQPKVLQPKLASSIMQLENKDQDHPDGAASGPKLAGDELPPPPPLKMPMVPVAEMVEALTPRKSQSEVKDPALKAIDISNEIHKQALLAIKTEEQEELVSPDRHS